MIYHLTQTHHHRLSSFHDSAIVLAALLLLVPEQAVWHLRIPISVSSPLDREQESKPDDAMTLHHRQDLRMN